MKASLASTSATTCGSPHISARSQTLHVLPFFYPQTRSFCHLSSPCTWQLRFPSFSSQKARSGPSCLHDGRLIVSQLSWLHRADTQVTPPPPRSPTSLLRPPPPPTGGFAVALNLVSPEPPHPAAFGLESEQIARPSHPPAALISLGRAVRGPAKRGTMPSLPRHLISSSPFCSFSGSHSGPPRSPSTAHSRLRPPSAGISHAPHSSASAPSIHRPDLPRWRLVK